MPPTPPAKTPGPPTPQSQTQSQSQTTAASKGPGVGASDDQRKQEEDAHENEAGGSGGSGGSGAGSTNDRRFVPYKASTLPAPLNRRTDEKGPGRPASAIAAKPLPKLEKQKSFAGINTKTPAPQTVPPSSERKFAANLAMEAMARARRAAEGEKENGER